jgi:hypothetical protein
MDVEILSRLQFAGTAMFHYLFPPLTIGLGLIMVIIEGIWLKTRDPSWNHAARFWTRIFALNFAIGVATGIVMEFQFGTNWADLLALRRRRLRLGPGRGGHLRVLPRVRLPRRARVRLGPRGAEDALLQRR